MITVLIVDDHRLVRAGLTGLLDAADGIEVTGEAADGEQALAAVARTDPDVILMDISMPVLDGVGATRAIIERSPQARVVALTSFGEGTKVAEMLGAGAVGYVLKDTEPDQLVSSIRAAAAGQVPIDPRVAGSLLPNRGRPGDGLSDRETQVLRLVARGLANKQIGRALGISERTVKVHLGNVFRRIGVADRTSAAIWARDHLPVDS